MTTAIGGGFLSFIKIAEQFKRLMVYCSTKPKEMRPGLISSLNASYTANEILDILHDSNLKDAVVKK
jgi:hypothetical protein